LQKRTYLYCSKDSAGKNVVRAMKDDIARSDLKTILHSKRANLYYLEKCRIMQKDGRIVYLTETKKENLFWNIPIANTTVILLGSGTSVTQAAMRLLSGAGVLVGFCGGGATPLFAGTEVEWLNPQSEYRPTEYVQGWLSFWFDEKKNVLLWQRSSRKSVSVFCRQSGIKTMNWPMKVFLPMML